MRQSRITLIVDIDAGDDRSQRERLEHVVEAVGVGVRVQAPKRLTAFATARLLEPVFDCGS